VPSSVAFALVRVLIRNGVLETRDGHIEVVGKPGLTLEYPTDAAPKLWGAITHHAKLKTPLGILGHLIRGREVSGTGDLSPGQGGSSSGGRWVIHPPTREQLQEHLDRLQWQREEIINTMGKESARDAKVILDHIVLRMEAEAARAQTSVSSATAQKPATSSPAGISRIQARLSGSVADQATEVWWKVESDARNWIPAGDLADLGISPKTIHSALRNREGLHQEKPVRYSRTGILAFVSETWVPHRSRA